MKKICFSLMLAIAIFSSQSALGWNGTGHIIVARIAWDNMTPKARKNVVTLLMQAPNDACLRDLFPNDSRPLEIRQREFFMFGRNLAGCCSTGGPRYSTLHQVSPAGVAFRRSFLDRNIR